MKSVLFLLVAFIAAASFTSCKKEYNCQCTFSDTTKNFTIKLGLQYKNDAKVLCTDYSQYIGNCALK